MLFTALQGFDKLPRLLVATVVIRFNGFQHSAMLHAVCRVQAFNAQTGLVKFANRRGRVSLMHSEHVTKVISFLHVLTADLGTCRLRFRLPQIYRPGRDVITSSSSYNFGRTTLPPSGLERHRTLNYTLVPRHNCCLPTVFRQVSSSVDISIQLKIYDLILLVQFLHISILFFFCTKFALNI